MTLAFVEPLTYDFPYITDRRHQPMFVTITPALADEWLKRVPETQRSVRDDAVERFKKDMLGGRWATDYSPYRFDKHGKLIDGQHRLWAIVEANVILTEQAVVFGMDPNDYETLDQGTKRTFADTLKYYGYTNTLLLSALTYRYWYWKKSQDMRKGNVKPVQHELLPLVRAHEDEMSAALKVGSRITGHVKPITNSVASLCFMLCNRVDEGDAKEFFDRLIDGQGLIDGDPIYALRNRWAPNAAKKRDKTPDWVQGAHILKAWNYYRDGKQVELLSWRAGGAKPEPFPQPK
jgi:hypothetical protein